MPKRKEPGPMYACVVMSNWTDPPRPVYSSFSTNLEDTIEYAKRMPGVIQVEEAHAGKPPVWVRPPEDAA